MKGEVDVGRLTKIMGERIRQLRKARTALTQTEFGALLGYSRSMISAIERGDRRMEHDKILAASRILGVEPPVLTWPRELSEEELDLVIAFYTGLENPDKTDNWGAIRTLLLDTRKKMDMERRASAE